MYIYVWTVLKSQTQKSNVIQQLLKPMKVFGGSSKKKFTNLKKIIVNQTDKYQEIFGFGGAVTDSAAINILNLTHDASDNLLKYNE